MATFPHVSIQDAADLTARAIKGFDFGSAMSGLSHVPCYSDGTPFNRTSKMPAVSSRNIFQSPGSSYTSGEWVANSNTAGSVVKLEWAPAIGAGTIRRARVRKSDQAVATPTLRLWLWDASFTVAVGNDASGAQPLADSIGFVDVAVVLAGSDDAVGWTNVDIPFAATTLYGLLQSQSTFTGAASEQWQVDLWELPG